jgi:type I restriction enzyme S subunit
MENGKAAIARNLENGTGAGSTEFFVLRPTSRILSEYVFHFIRRTSFRATCKANFTGSAGQQRVPKSFLEKVAIPLPSLDEQRRIVGLLDRAAEIRRRADAARAKARAIIPALFLDTFGDPATNPKGWPETQLSEVLATTLSYGSMTSPRASNDDWLDIRVANIKGGQIDHSDRKYVTLERSLVAKHSLVDGDIVLARAIGSESHLGKCAVAYPGKKRWAYDSHIMRIRVDQNRISPVWLHTLMNTDGGKARLLRQKRASAIQHNINTKEVAIFTFPLPPLPLQTAFAEQVQRLESLARHLDAAAAKAEAMAAGLSAEVFG